jgi:hypothetical protein
MGPALGRFARRVRTTVGLLATKATHRKDDDAPPARRTTAPAPGGGLHASGRKVIRGDGSSSTYPGVSHNSRSMDEIDADIAGIKKIDRRKLAVGGAVLVAVVLGAVALHKPSGDAVATNAGEAAASASSAPAPQAIPGLDPIAPIPASGLGVIPPAPSAATAAPNAYGNGFAGGNGMAGGPASVTTGEAIDDDTAGSGGEDKPAHHRKAPHAPSFGNGVVSHGNVLRLRMDGAIERLQGASQANGFTVVVPNRRSLEAAAPLASRDSRIATIRVANEPNGAELTVTFRDGVPNYQVKGKGDSLEIALAPMGVVNETRGATQPMRAPHHPVHHNARHHRR